MGCNSSKRWIMDGRQGDEEARVGETRMKNLWETYDELEDIT